MKISRKKRVLASFISWLPVISLAGATFVFNTSEFIPIGLLNAIALDFKMSEAGVGWMISIYAWVVALASLPLMLYFSQTELKKLMLCVMALFVLSHIFSALAQNYLMLIISRVGVALSHALFWSIVTPMAVRAAPRNKRSLALSIVVTGSSLALIAGLPIGRVIGLYLSWRTTFASIGVIAFLIMLLFWRKFKNMPSNQNISLKTLPKILKNKRLIKIYILTMIFITGHFTAYTYIEPFLLQIAKLNKDTITAVLVLFGCSGIIASVVFSKFYDKYPMKFVNLCLFGVVGSLFVLYFSAFSVISVVALCVFWGFAMMCYNIVFQSQAISISPHYTTVAMSIYSGIYNVGIGGGAFVGGIVCKHLDVKFIGLIGGVIALLACVFYLRKMSFIRALRLKKLRKIRTVKF